MKAEDISAGRGMLVRGMSAPGHFLGNHLMPTWGSGSMALMNTDENEQYMYEAQQALLERAVSLSRAHRHRLPQIAHGLFGLALMEGLKYRLGHFEGTAIASLGWTVKFSKAIYIGDTLHCQVRITKMRETKKPSQGIMWEEVRLINQNDELVTEAEHSIMLRRKEA